jgi:hypothetical protein
MADKSYSLNEDEIYALDTLLYENKHKVKRNAIIFGVIAVVISLVPMGFLPRSRRLADEDKSSSLIQAMGFGWWVLLFILVLAGVVFLLRLDKKIATLTQDLEGKEGLELTVKVTKKYSESTPEYYCILVSNETLKNQKIILDREQFKTFGEGQVLSIRVFKNSKILIS